MSHRALGVVLRAKPPPRFWSHATCVVTDGCMHPHTPPPFPTPSIPLAYGVWYKGWPARNPIWNFMPLTFGPKANCHYHSLVRGRESSVSCAGLRQH
jgi:hypothetical protein